MKALKIVVLSMLSILPIIFLAGCGLNPTMTYEEKAITTGNIVLTDNRPKTGNETRIERTKALVYYADTAFTPRIQDLLRNSLEKYSKSSLNIELTELTVIQDYGFSLARTIGGGIAVEVISGGYLGEQRIKQGSDVIACISSGTVNGKPFKTGAIVPYKLNPFSSPVWNDEQAILAAREAIDQVAYRIVEAAN